MKLKKREFFEKKRNRKVKGENKQIFQNKSDKIEETGNFSLKRRKSLSLYIYCIEGYLVRSK